MTGPFGEQSLGDHVDHMSMKPCCFLNTGIYVCVVHSHVAPQTVQVPCKYLLEGKERSRLKN